MKHSTDNNRNKYILATWILVGIITISPLLLPLPSIQIIALGLVIAIQYKARSLSKVTLGVISVVYLAISVLWLVDL
jgi:hypothetical protein